MTDPLATRVGELVDLGWSLKSQTETTAGFETRKPINWWLFALLIILFFGLGALLYLIFWLLTSRASLFLSVKEGAIVASGDVWLVEEQERERETMIARVREIKQKGFWRVMWPAVVAVIAIVAVWFVLFWYVLTSHVN